MLRSHTALRVASAFMALAVALIGVQAFSARCPTDAPCCPKAEQKSDELVNARLPCCEHPTVQRILPQPTRRSKRQAPLIALAIVPVLAQVSVRPQTLYRPPPAVPLIAQSLYKRNCALLL